MIRAPGNDGTARARAEALEAVREDDLERARERLATAIAAAPGDVAAWTNYGAVLGELGLVEEARHALETALALDPAALEAASNLGVLARESGRLDDAERLFRGLLVRVPDSLAARYNLAHTLFLAARFDEAAEAYREGLRRDAAKTGSQNARLAWALLAAGRGAEARRELRRALGRIAPEETEALRAEAAEVLAAIAAAKPEIAEEVARLKRTLIASIGGP